ncbi:AAA family ATPase [Flavisolibacter sp. BT320]|nr:AAA family ATPase [Flavisolibacter longurius]
MIIKKIEIQNFMCYEGQNIFDFSEGLNVIIGDNGYGKSKLFDAFYWALYDQVFVSEQKKFQNTKEVRSKIVSDKAKNECNEDKLTTSVKVTFYNPDRDNSYIIERKYSLTQNGQGWKEGSDGERLIWKKDMSFMNASLVTDEDDKARILNTILPDNIKPYMWFQGEQVESIIDFNQHDTLTRAINVLSNISQFDQLKSIAEAAAKTARSEYDKELKKASKDKVKSEDLEKKKKQLEERLSYLTQEYEKEKENHANAEDKAEKLLYKIQDAKKIRELESEKKNVQRQLEDLHQRIIDDQIAFHKKLFKNKWLLKGTEDLLNSYSEQYANYNNNKLRKMAEVKARIDAEKAVMKKLQTRLPIDVPEPIYVEQMLKEERCRVCDREAPKGSEAWNRIKELLDRPDEKIKDQDDDPLTKHDFSDEFKRLYHNGLGMSHVIRNADEDINETLSHAQELKRKQRELNKKYQGLDSDIQSLLASAALNLSDADNIINEYAEHTKKAKYFAEEELKTKQQIDTNKIKLAQVNDELKGLATGEIPSWMIDKLKVLEDFEDLAQSTRERVFSQLIKMLEEEANKHYSAMTSGNKSARGIIRLKALSNGNYMPELTDNTGNPLVQLNTGNIILIKLATIMAIISARQGTRTTDLYTLITDAPMSVFGEDYTIGFCRTVSQVYKQSIIMSKEFYRNEKLRKELLTNDEIKLGKVYLITPSITEDERVNRNTLSTNVKLLN